MDMATSTMFPVLRRSARLIENTPLCERLLCEYCENPVVEPCILNASCCKEHCTCGTGTSRMGFTAANSQHPASGDTEGGSGTLAGITTNELENSDTSYDEIENDSGSVPHVPQVVPLSGREKDVATVTDAVTGFETSEPAIFDTNQTEKGTSSMVTLDESSQKSNVPFPVRPSGKHDSTTWKQQIRLRRPWHSRRPRTEPQTQQFHRHTTTAPEVQPWRFQGTPDQQLINTAVFTQMHFLQQQQQQILATLRQPPVPLIWSPTININPSYLQFVNPLRLQPFQRLQ